MKEFQSKSQSHRVLPFWRLYLQHEGRIHRHSGVQDVLRLLHYISCQGVQSLLGLDLYAQMLSERYKLGDMSQYEELSDYDLFLAIGKKRGFLISGGEINTERTAIMLLDEFRACKLGRITLDRYSKEELHA